MMKSHRGIPLSAIKEHRRRVKFPSGLCSKCEEVFDRDNHSVMVIEGETWVVCAHCNTPQCKLAKPAYYTIKGKPFGTWQTEDHGDAVQILLGEEKDD